MPPGYVGAGKSINSIGSPLGNTPGTTSDVMGMMVALTGSGNSGIIPPHDSNDQWAYKQEILDAPAGANYILKRATFLDLSTGESYTYDYHESSGSGSGLSPLQILETVAVAIATGGAVNMAVGGVTGALVAADAVDKEKTLAETAQESAVVTGIVSAVGMAAGGVELMAPTVLGSAGAGAAGTTAAAETGAAGAAAGTGAVTAGVGAAATTLEKAIGSTILSTGLTALSTEIKKITGQLPSAPAQQPPPHADYVAPAPTTAPPPGPGFGVVAAGAVAALLFLKKATS